LFDLMITPIDPLGDLAPCLGPPWADGAQLHQPAAPGSILAQLAQNTTNTINAFTNFGTAIINLGVLNAGLPPQFLIDGIGGPANALSALNSSAVAFTGAVQAGNASSAAAALAEMPAVVTNGFLDGSTVITLPQASISPVVAEIGVVLSFGPELAAASHPPRSR
jgi:hypothetical protein